MGKRKLLLIFVLALSAVSLVVVPAAAQAITFTLTFHDETIEDLDVDFCTEDPVTLFITYNGVMHVTEFTEDHPNAGTFHGMLKLNGTVATVDGAGNIVSNDHFVKTIFHTNVNRQNFNENFNFIINGSRSDGGRHRFHLIGHINWSASGNPVEFTKLSVSCP